MHPRFRHLLLTATALLALGLLPVAAGPVGPTVVGGSATIQGAGTGSVIVNQQSGSAIVNWQSFNIGAGQTTTFIQPSSSSVILNRVTGGLGPSQILGTLTANGRVFLINRDGILFGPGAVINTAGFLASTHDIANQDFMAGKYNFTIPGRPDASIVNFGNITATSGGFAALVAPGVRNSGTITATLGTVTLAAGNSFTLDFYGDRLITLAVGDQIAAKVIDVSTGQPLKSLVTNDGKIKANGGRVELTAAAARVVVDSVINTSGVIKANSIGTHKGMIVLSAATSSSKPAGAPTQTVRVSGTLSAAGKKKGTSGGTILVTGEDIQFVNAMVDASGHAGGGKVLIGGDWAGGSPNVNLVSNASAKLEPFAVPTATTVSVDAATTIDASAKDNGNGGKVILWSDQMTTFAGTILARGGANGGNGGFVETSSHGLLNFAGAVDLRAPSGTTGTLLLDPYDVTISAAADLNMPPISGGIFTPTGTSNLNVTTLVNALGSSNVVVTTRGASPGTDAGNITVAANVSWSANHSLTLSAYNNIIFNAGVSLTSSGTGNIILRADNAGQGRGVTPNERTVFFAGGPQVFATGGGSVSLYYNPTSYSSPTNYSSNVSVSGGGTFTPYMLVNSVTDLQNIGTSSFTLNQTYALGKNIDNANAPFAPIGGNLKFFGLFDGNGGLGLNYTISNLNIAPNDLTTQNIGLFALIGNTGVVRNLNLTGADVSANPSYPSLNFSQFVGIVAGSNGGTISNVTVGGTVNGVGPAGNVTIGGLVGQNGLLGPTNFAGLITNSSAAVTVTAGNGGACPGPCNFNAAGGLVGANVAGSTISGSSATGTVTIGSNGWAGGLVGANGFSGINGTTGIIQNSYATGNVTATGTGVAVGGLVGQNAPNSPITNSRATGAVTATANLPAQPNGTDCSSGNCQFIQAGGLVGSNFGTISSTAVVPAPNQACAAGQTCATGNVSVGSRGTAGGLVGFNDGTITKAFATGAVIGAAGLGNLDNSGNSTTLGGLAGTNTGIIVDSHARGDVGALIVVPNLQIGGLVGDNAGTIVRSFAIGNVRAGDNSQAGGLSGGNSPFDNNCNGCTPGDGHNNLATIIDSHATGNVTVGAGSLAGGLVGGSDGLIYGTAPGLSYASGAVSGGGNSFLGGLVGVNGFDNNSGNFGSITLSTASGPVTSTGPNSVVGGFVGGNVGNIGSAVPSTSSSGAVIGTSSSYLGGFVGINLGFIQNSTTAATASVTGTGANNVIGGFVGANFGLIDPSSAAGNVTGGPGNIIGGFSGANATFTNPNFVGLIPASSFPVGTLINTSFTGLVNGASGGPAVGASNPTSLPAAYPSIINTCGAFGCEILRTGRLSESTPPPPPPPPPWLTDNLINTTRLAALAPAPVTTVARPPATRAAPSSPGQPAPTAFQRIFDIPPPNETRFVADQVLLQILSNVTVQQIEEAVRRFGLTLMASQALGATGTTALQFHIANGQSVRDIIRQLASIQIVAVAQPVYLYALAQQPPAPPPASDQKPPAAAQYDPAQYVVDKLRLVEVHRIATGTNVTIAVIDSEIDAAHPALSGVIAQRFSAVGTAEKPHAHGTGMAGAIASHEKLLGIAPAARLFAVHAFSTSAASAESTTFQILKGIDWATSQGARIINMSFAGPKDPSLERSLKAAYDKGIVLIAAAGNAGPRSAPLYPGADPNVIAVTATDADDKIFSGANRGRYIAVAAPGVDILVPAPEGNYQLTTGTSVAAAEVSGLVALLLERNPKLKPADIRRILTESAKRLGPGPRDDNFGSGLIDPLKAIQMTNPRVSAAPPLQR